MFFSIAEVELFNYIGRGGQGLVQRGRYHDKDVALKSIVAFDDNQIASFIQEIKILRWVGWFSGYFCTPYWDSGLNLCSQVKHKNIVEFVGIIVSKNSKIYMVTELMATDLNTIKHKLTLYEKLKIAKDVCEAM